MPSFTVNFDLDINSPTYGKWILTDTTNYSALGWNINDVVGWFTISFPNGSQYTGSQLNPDFNVGNGSNNSISIPQDANGNWLTGNYIFVMYVYNSDNLQTLSTTISYKYCAQFLFNNTEEAVIATTTDCFQYRLNVQDKTDYGTPTTKVETLTLYPPQPLIDSGDAPIVFTSSSSLVYVFGYTGTYVATVDTLVTYVSGGVTITGRVKGDKETSVQCSQNICNLIACYNDKVRKYNFQIQKGAYLESVDNGLKTDLVSALLYLQGYFSNANCGNYTKATEYYNLIAKTLNCDCGCDDKPSDDIRLVNPNFTPSTSTIYNVIGAGNIQVTSNTVGDATTFTVSLSDGFIDAFNQLGIDVRTLQGEVNTLQGQVSALQTAVSNIDVLNQVVYEVGQVNVTNSATWIKTAEYTAAQDTLEIGTELDLLSVFYIGGGSSDDRDIKIQINGADVLVLNDPILKGNTLYGAKAMLKLQVISNTTATYQATISVINLNSVEQFKTTTNAVFSTSPLTINNITTNSNIISVFGKTSGIALLTQLNANCKQFNKV